MRIDAGGCVQTGGSGRTWKLYVDPRGPNSNKFYYGLVYLPGFGIDFDSNYELNGYRRISSIIGREIEVRDPPCPPRADCVAKHKGDDVGILQLGYADDDYHDNGYWSHDNGTDDQCQNVGPAWVEVTIDRYLGGIPLEQGADRPGLDYNNFDLPQANPELCRDACSQDNRCKAFTYVRPGVQGDMARCWLKSDVPSPVQNDCCVSGVK